MDELKRCPECGGVATVIHMYDTYDRADQSALCQSGLTLLVGKYSTDDTADSEQCSYPAGTASENDRENTKYQAYNCQYVGLLVLSLRGFYNCLGMYISGIVLIIVNGLYHGGLLYRFCCRSYFGFGNRFCSRSIYCNIVFIFKILSVHFFLFLSCSDFLF